MIKRKQVQQYKNNYTEVKEEWEIKVITKLPNSEQSYKGKVQTHNYINRQNQPTTGLSLCKIVRSSVILLLPLFPIPPSLLCSYFYIVELVFLMNMYDIVAS
jgi:hypothetical protein